MIRTAERAEREESEGGIVSDMRVSFGSNRKMLAVAVLGLPMILAALVWLLLPRESERELSLEVTPIATAASSDLRESLGQPEPSVDPETTGQQAVRFLRAGNFDPVEVVPNYNYTTGQVDVLLRARGKEPLNDFGSEEVTDSIESSFREVYEEAQAAPIENRLQSLESRIEATREGATQLERQIETSSSLAESPEAPEGSRATEAEKISNLETQREGTLATLAGLESEKGYMEQTYEDLPMLAREQISVEMVTESGVREVTRLTSALTAAALLGFLAAVALSVRIAAGQTGKSMSSST